MTRWLLYAVAGEAEAEFVLGDLEEEFLEIARLRGRRSARRWYASQVLRSILPLLALRIRSGELMHALVAGLGAGAPLWLADRLWTFLYSQIPLKDGVERTPAQFGVTLAVLCACAAAAGATARTRERAIAVCLSAILMTAAALAVSTGSTPALFVAMALLLAPLSASLWHWRRSR
jgi:hypothetical protein